MMKNRSLRNKIFIPIIVTVVGGFVLIIISKVFFKDQPTVKKEYNVKSKDQSGGVTAGEFSGTYNEYKTKRDDTKDGIVAERYFGDMNLFLFKFRLIVYSYFSQKGTVPKVVNDVLVINEFMLENSSKKTSPSLISDDVITLIFYYYDFSSYTSLRFINSRPYVILPDSRQYDFHLPENLKIMDGDTITGYAWLIGELRDLQSRNNKLLKYPN